MFWLKRLGSLAIGIGVCFLIDMLAHKQSDYAQRLVVLAGLYVTLAVSLNLINGITGQFSIGHAAFYQIGAYFAAYLTSHYFEAAHLPPLVWLAVMAVAGAFGAAVAGFVVGLPSLRLRGDYLAIVTLGFGEIIRIQVQNTPSLGGAYGMNVNPTIKPIWMIWLLAMGCIAVSRNLVKTAHGLPFLAVREDEVASAAMGVNVTRVKVSAFVLGSAFAGAAGAFLAHYEGFITPTTFAMDTSFIILTMVVLGGTGSITGSAVAAIFLSYLPEQLRGLKNASGTALTVSSASVVAGLIAVVIAVALMKRIGSNAQPTKLSESLAPVGNFFKKLFTSGPFKAIHWPSRYSKTVSATKHVLAVVIAVVCKILIQTGLNRYTKLGGSEIAVEQLRMVIFAVTLVVLMLLRPQGIFGHHEFSWTWVQRLFRRRRGGDGQNPPAPAVAA